MSEQILQAVMQLFAIIAKQDDGATASQRLFVENFLKFQLASEKVGQYLKLYDNFLIGDTIAEGKAGAATAAKRTSVKDSVQILGICVKINKTLTQQQKVVVLIRLLEMLKKENQFTDQRLKIIETVSFVFNISKEDQNLINQFIRTDDLRSITSEDLLIVDGTEISNSASKSWKHFYEGGLSGEISVVHIRSVDLYFAKYSGNNIITINGLSFVPDTVYLFATGSNIRLPKNTLYFSDVVSLLQHDKPEGILTFTAKNIFYTFPNGRPGLRDVTISEQLGSMVAIMGASGAGKTTLLNVLCGLEHATKGQIEINGNIFSKGNKDLEGIIGYIAQDDLLIESLTVYENLFFNAKLCCSNLSLDELNGRVANTLKSLGLFEAKDIIVGNPLDKKISGGQRKRLNIALELIREPSVLFVDEPTSGLSSADSENVMSILKDLTFTGKLIFVVIHQPSSEIYKMFDKLILMDVGGYPVFYGNPIDAIMYFRKQTKQANADESECYACGSVNPETLFKLLESKEVDEFGRFLPERKIKPEEWNNLYTKNIPEKIINAGKTLPPKIFTIPGRFKQWLIFIMRDLKSKISNTQYVLISLLEAPLLAAILGFVIRYSTDPEKENYMFRKNENLPAYLFISIVVSLFIGLTVSAEEIFKDRKILKREAFLSLSNLSYLASKLFILFSLSAIQTALFVFAGNSILEIKGMFLDYWLVLFSVSCFANILGLNISVSFNTAVTIYILIPIMVIPQMIFGGAMFSFDKINHLLGGNQHKSPLIADVFVSRWAYEALTVNQFIENKFEKGRYEYDKQISEINYKQGYYLPKLKKLANESLAIMRDGSNAAQKPTFFQNMRILTNECSKELALFPQINSNISEELKSGKFSFDNLNNLILVIEEIDELYTKKYQIASKNLDSYKLKLTNTPEKSIAYHGKRDLYENDRLNEVVKKSTELYRIKIQGDKLVQVMDPVFQDPSPAGRLDYRAHFFSPKKYFLGKYYSTFSFNLGVIWLMSAILFITLYFELYNRITGFFKRRL